MTYSGVFVDLDGTVWRGRDPVPGVADAVRALRERGVPLVFVTNNTGVRRDDFHARLDALGIDPDAGEVVTAAWATAEYLAEYRPNASVHVMGQDVVADELAAAGLTVSESGTADVVVVGYDERVSMDRLTGALRAFGPGTDFVATNRDSTTPHEDGPMPGAGAFVAAVEEMTDHDPLVVGKPSTRMADVAADILGVPLDECLMVGDNLHTDVLMGDRAGMDTALVLTGVSDRADIETTDITPTHVLDSIADVPTLFEN
ncbi:HAD-IIA family hydrolase [Salarchaeum japonicum]|uniref:HAD-IIA family hydrolase n=1 Tax=Salarchaeum japonicum TaxID=555573 RepID=A0AAV3T2N4_9EURY|nr:HAD-IIA family hydrolase [Salarchaeum japonicum]